MAELRWREREPPLSPVAAVALGAAVGRLWRRLGRAGAAELAGLEGAWAEGALVLLSRGSALPWVEGLVYLGRDPRAPQLLVPTAIEPELHPALVEAAVLGRVKQRQWPVAVLVEAGRLLVVRAPRRLDPGLVAGEAP